MSTSFITLGNVKRHVVIAIAYGKLNDKKW